MDWNVAEFGTTIGPFLQHVVRARGFVERCGFLTSFILMNGTLDASGTCFAVCRSTLDSRAQAHLRLHIRVSTVSKSCVIHLVRSEGSANICREWRILGILHKHLAEIAEILQKILQRHRGRTQKILTSIPFKSCTLPLAQPRRPRWTLLLLLILFYTFSCIFAQLVWLGMDFQRSSLGKSGWWAHEPHLTHELSRGQTIAASRPLT